MTVSDVKIMSSSLDTSITNLVRTCMAWIVDPNLLHSYPWESLCTSRAAASGSILCMWIVYRQRTCWVPHSSHAYLLYVLQVNLSTNLVCLMFPFTLVLFSQQSRKRIPAEENNLLNELSYHNPHSILMRL